MADTTYCLSGAERGLWLGLGPTRLAVLGVGILTTVLGAYTGAPVPLAAVPVVAAVAWCFGTVAGSPVHELTRAGSAAAARAVTGGRSWSRAAWMTTAQRRLEQPGRPERLELPSECGRLLLASVHVDGLEVGLLAERARTGWDTVCLLRVVGDPGFALADAAEQVRRLAGWGDVLTALAGEYAGRCRLQWVEHATRSSDLVPDETQGAVELRTQVAAAARVHEVLLAARVSTRTRDLTAALAETEPAYRLLASRLLAAELLAAPLNPTQVASQLARGTRPCSADVAVSLAGPVSRREAWDHVRTDDTLHRGYLVTGWPRVPVGASWLTPLLSDSPEVGARSVTVHLEAVPAQTASRRARAARQGADLDAGDRVSLGFGLGARERRAQADAAAVEDELAAGHALHRLAGLVLISASSLPELDAAGRQTLAAASAARLELRPLHGRHAKAWAATLPLCRLRHRAPA